MAEYWTCNECQVLYDDMDGDTDERMCHKCLDKEWMEYDALKALHKPKISFYRASKERIARKRKEEEENE